MTDSTVDKLTFGSGLSNITVGGCSYSSASMSIRLHPRRALYPQPGMDQAFDFIGSKDFSGTAGELRFEKSSGGTDVHGDVNGDGQADFAIHLSHSSS